MKKYLLPILIIFVAGLVGASLLLNQKLKQSNAVISTESGQSLRLLSFKAPGMFCLGCSASVEGYLKVIKGVQSVNASLATKQVDVVYDDSVVDKDTILDDEILDVYGKKFLSDVSYTGGNQAKTPSTTNLPQSLAFKLQEAAFLVQQLENPEDHQETFDRIDSAIASEDFDKAESLLDDLLEKLAQ
jgi:copper chaperone CopZ